VGPVEATQAEPHVRTNLRIQKLSFDGTDHFEKSRETAMISELPKSLRPPEKGCICVAAPETLDDGRRLVWSLLFGARHMSQIQ
jgi:hypothetical protein